MQNMMETLLRLKYEYRIKGDNLMRKVNWDEFA